VPDDRYLSMISLRVFQAGLKHAMVAAKWPAFEEVFAGFAPAPVAAMHEERIEALMADKRLIRHLPKLRSVPANAQAILAIADEAGSFGAWLADWPVDDITGLWAAIAKRFKQMGGSSTPYVLRRAGKDTFILTNDVNKALIAAGVIDRKPTSKRDLASVQAVFNAWASESGRPLCHLSRIAALSVG
jgi:3-methyladenine DNA glycosylase Tag